MVRGFYAGLSREDGRRTGSPRQKGSGREEAGHMYLVTFSAEASRDKRRLKEAGLEERARMLLHLIAENPFQDPPACQAARGSLQDYYSRRINLQHRIVYQVDKDGTSGREREAVRQDICLPEPYEGIVYIKRMWTSP